MRSCRSWTRGCQPIGGLVGLLRFLFLRASGFVPCTWVPGAPTGKIVKNLTCFEVYKRIKQRFLFADLHLAANCCPLVAIHVVVDAVDLEQASIRSVVPFADIGNNTVLVDYVATSTVRTAAGFPEDDLPELFPGVLRPASLRSQSWEPRNVTVGKGDPVVLDPVFGRLRVLNRLRQVSQRLDVSRASYGYGYGT